MTEHLTDTISRLYTDPGEYVDSDHPAVEAFARAAVPAGASARDKASRLYTAVRDGIRYNPYVSMRSPESYRASSVLAAGNGYCVGKAALYAAACRVHGIPARVGFADVRNHLTTEKLRQSMGSDLFTWHGFTEVFVDGAWRKATPTFNDTLCAKLGVKPLDFDGHSDALLHPFDGEGRAYMQYVNDHGTYHDVPAKFLMREMAREYANMQGEDMSGRDMEQEAAEQQRHAGGGGGVMDAELPKAQAARPATGWDDTVALTGFILVAVGQASNQVLARGLAGSVPPFSLAFFRWSIIAIGLAPFAIAAVRDGKIPLAQNLWPILAAGFLGMFLCGGPVYIAGITTTAIHIALIFALSPIMVLLISAALGIEHIGPLQWLGTALALAGALLIVSGGHLEALTQSSAAWGDLLVVGAMLGWSGYTLVQSRVAPRASLLARVSLFSAAGALCSLPPALLEMWTSPAAVFNARAFEAYVFAGLVPGLLAYAGFAWLGARFGSVRTSLVLYVAPIASALLSWLILGEPPKLIHLVGGLLILGGVWASLRK